MGQVSPSTISFKAATQNLIYWYYILFCTRQFLKDVKTLGGGGVYLDSVQWSEPAKASGPNLKLSKSKVPDSNHLLLSLKICLKNSAL